MAMMESRREFLKKSSVLLGGAAVLGLTGCGLSDDAWNPNGTADGVEHCYL